MTLSGVTPTSVQLYNTWFVTSYIIGESIYDQKAHNPKQILVEMVGVCRYIMSQSQLCVTFANIKFKLKRFHLNVGLCC